MDLQAQSQPDQLRDVRKNRQAGVDPARRQQTPKEVPKTLALRQQTVRGLLSRTTVLVAVRG